MNITRLVISAAVLALATTGGGQRASAGDHRGVPSAVGQKAPDGLPVTIPAPGSAVPTTAEWDAVNWEVTVRKSSAYHCESKMVREWLRVSCVPYEKWTPKAVTTLQSHGHQAFTGVYGTKASLVVQVVKGKMYVARYTWGPDNSTRDLTVNWASGDRPQFYFN